MGALGTGGDELSVPFLFEESDWKFAVPCYDAGMTTAFDPKIRRTMRIPVTTMEEVPVLSEMERAKTIASLQQAEAEVAAGNFTVFDPETFVTRLMIVRAEALRKRTI